MKNPREGIYATFTTEYAGLGGDANFIKFTTRGNYYHTLSEEYDVVGLLTGGAGYITGIGDGGLRVFDLFQSSDRIIRGFDFNGIGPYQRNAAGGIDHVGGKIYFHASAETQFPLPLIPQSLGLKVRSSRTRRRSTATIFRSVRAVRSWAPARRFGHLSVSACSGLRRSDRCASTTPFRSRNRTPTTYRTSALASRPGSDRVVAEGPGCGPARREMG